MDRIKLLPHWCLTGSKPAFYDTESATAIEQTAKLYGAMRELQDDYNKFVDEINIAITRFVEGIETDQTCFINLINKTVNDYIVTLDTKIEHQDREVNNAIEFMKTNLNNSITQIINEMKELGELDSTILNALNNVSDEITGIKTNITTINEELTSLDTRIDNVNVELLNTNNKIDTIETNISEMEQEIADDINSSNLNTVELINELKLALHPIGSIEINVSGINPETYIGGTWEAWGSGRVPVGVDTSQTEFGTVEKEGGEKTHLLTQEESGLREHTHYLPLSNTPGTLGEGDFPVRGLPENEENPEIQVETGFRTGRVTAISNNVNDFGALFIDETYGDKNALEPHNNLQPYITCYMWKRIA